MGKAPACSNQQPCHRRPHPANAWVLAEMAMVIPRQAQLSRLAGVETGGGANTSYKYKVNPPVILLSKVHVNAPSPCCLVPSCRCTQMHPLPQGTSSHVACRQGRECRACMMQRGRLPRRDARRVQLPEHTAPSSRGLLSRLRGCNLEPLRQLDVLGPVRQQGRGARTGHLNTGSC